MRSLNPKSEYRNPKQILNSNVPNSKPSLFGKFGFGKFGFVSCFEFRASDLTVSIAIILVLLCLILPQTIQAAAPVAYNQALVTDEDTSISITLTASDADGDSLTYTTVTAPSHGSFTTNTPPNLVYKPTTNYNGVDSFTFKANDGTSDSNIATVSLTINPINDAPVVSSVPGTITFAIKPGETAVAKTYTLIVTDPEGDSLTYSVVGLPSGASFNTQTGEITWTITHQDIASYPNITFTVSDGQLQSSKTVTLVVREAVTYYCDPNGNTQTGDGSEGNPWGTLESIINASNRAAGKFGQYRDTGVIRSGDTVKLNAGFHGKASFYDGFPEPQDTADYITIEPNGNAVADLSGIQFRYCHYYRIKGLRLSPDFATPSLVQYHPTKYEDYAIIDSSAANHLIIEDCNIFTVMDTSQWDPEKWSYWAWSGIKRHDGVKSSIIRNNIVRNVGYGIYSAGNSLVEGNLIDGFCFDAMKVAGPDTVIQDNTILNIYLHVIPGGYPHADAMQIPAGASGNNITIRRNYICACTDPNRSMYYANPLTWTLGTTYSPGDYAVCDNDRGVPIIYWCREGAGHVASNNNKPGWGVNWQTYWFSSVEGLQGIFTSISLTNSLIENNVIIVTSATHGISLTGGTNTRIINNTVLRPYGVGWWPNIYLSGTGSQNFIIRNNIADGWTTGAGITADHNLDISNYDPNVEFVDYAHGNVHLAAGSSFIDVGESADAPNEDLERHPRPQGQGYDLGAYEYGTSSILYGDVSGDSEISAYDAALTAQAAVDLITLTPEQFNAADVDGSQDISAYDAALIAQYSVGLISKFPVEG